MSIQVSKAALIQQLQQDILRLQSGHRQSLPPLHTGLGILEQAFPQQCFPAAGLHELISYAPGHAAATQGFLAGLLQHILPQQAYTLWISTWRRLFPPALTAFGLDPSRVIFVDIPRNKEALWAFEEALKSGAVAAVVAEIPNVSFTESRRLQLALEEHQVTGLLHRYQPRSDNTIACVARWKVESAPSLVLGELPGIGFPAWRVQLLRVRNGRPGQWSLAWVDGGFQHRVMLPVAHENMIRKAM
ncbi:MAG: Error-prone repair protein ImuA [Bacteroidetes bacterium]|nr:Error-prone repair protein ImuA [Bacteroidota bacterium]